MDQFSLVQPVDGFGQGVVITVTTTGLTRLHLLQHDVDIDFLPRLGWSIKFRLRSKIEGCIDGHRVILGQQCRICPFCLIGS